MAQLASPNNPLPDGAIASADKAPSIVVTRTEIAHARFSVVDVHTHFWVKAKHDSELLDRYVESMDRNGIAVSVSLDGMLNERLDSHFEYLWKKYRDRFVVFANLDFVGNGNYERPKTLACNQPNFVRNVVEQLRRECRQGRVSGLKFFKDFGLRYCKADGSLWAIDDPNWDPIWNVCGELGIPVIMHTADPSAFFLRVDPSNERFGELQAHPDWSFADPKFPRRAELHAARNRVIAKHPQTQFIAAHFANDAEDLQQLSQWLETYPNLHIEFSSRLNELGRQPFTARKFFERYADRILFGTDGPWPEQRLKIYWRFLETEDEYFAYSEKTPPPQGDWRIYGIHLSEQTLKSIYQENAARLIPGVRERLERFERLSR